VGWVGPTPALGTHHSLTTWLADPHRIRDRDATARSASGRSTDWLAACLGAEALAPRGYRGELSAVSKIVGHALKEEWRVFEDVKGGLMNLVGRHVHIIVLNVTAALLCVL
jgi:hypothetical protein